MKQEPKFQTPASAPPSRRFGPSKIAWAPAPAPQSWVEHRTKMCLSLSDAQESVFTCHKMSLAYVSETWSNTSK